MKSLSIILSVLFCLTITTKFVAQETVPKEVLLNTLNGVNELKLSNLKTESLMKYNKEFVDKVYEILESDKIEKDKVSALKVLSNDTERDLTDLLGKKGVYNKYVKLMEEEMKPLVKRQKLLKYLYK